MVDRGGRRRLFLALWPDAATRAKLADIQAVLGRNQRLKKAKPVPVANMHITTHFLGNVSDDVHTQLVALLAGVNAQACTLVIDRWGYFPKARVLWLGAQASPDALSDLVQKTQVCVETCLDGYQQKRFVPHITLFRKARHPLEVDDFEPVEWRIDRYVLVESVTHPEGPEYIALNEWSLN